MNDHSMNAVEIFNLQPHKDLYDVLMRATDAERESLCDKPEYKAICALLVYDRFLYNNSESPLALHKLGRAQFKIVLDSFPEDFSQGLALIEATHPAFIYTDEFKAYVKGHLKITDDKGAKVYTLGHYSYRVSRFDDGHVSFEEWRYKNKKHRENGPAVISYCEEEPHRVESKIWYFKDMLHREDGPAYIYYWPNSTVEHLVEWFKYNYCTRVDGPAKIFRLQDGTLDKEVWYRMSEKHRVGEPAVITYEPDGQTIKDAEYWEHGKKK